MSRQKLILTSADVHQVLCLPDGVEVVELQVHEGETVVHVILEGDDLGAAGWDLPDRR